MPHSNPELRTIPDWLLKLLVQFCERNKSMGYYYSSSTGEYEGVFYYNDYSPWIKTMKAIGYTFIDESDVSSINWSEVKDYYQISHSSLGYGYLVKYREKNA